MNYKDIITDKLKEDELKKETLDKEMCPVAEALLKKKV